MKPVVNAHGPRRAIWLATMPRPHLAILFGSPVPTTPVADPHFDNPLISAAKIDIVCFFRFPRSSELSENDRLGET